MSENPTISKVLVSEEYQLALNGAKLCVEKFQAASVCDDKMAAMHASRESIKFYNRSLELIRQRISEIEKEEALEKI